ncbi:hypothetical protein PHLGIDRAFT_413549 [Phlebiopsis gigantea 11061_1 CR5-6]|uniref:F-box domain-containing protein n=1 Tax=Phlebiopsis gigantea (strain 11061_1 CR5-6) TaxID=745531 RepID=A0A0C3NQZ5_PHLG1|nr:hypothetical protein PHLGIDRAFT_413549 [Phlebiopsis gigantea 11061_1 CR5-6]
MGQEVLRRPSGPSLNDLPVELLGAVVGEVTSIGDLLRLRVVNHTFSVYATPKAFRTFHVVNTEASVTGQKLLMSSPGLASLVQRLVVHCEAGPGENRLLNTVEEDEEAKAIRMAFAYNMSRLHLFPSLGELELNFFSGMVWQTVESAEDGTITMTHPSKYFMLQSFIMQAVLKPQTGCPPPLLRSLTLNNLIPFPAPEYQSEVLETIMSNLHSFSMSAHALRFKGRRGEDMWSWFWSEMVPERFLEPAQKSLTSLSLFSDQPIGQFPTVDLSWLRFPRLTTLTLGGLTFNEQGLAEDFVVHHGRTLQRLTLDTCAMHLGGTAPVRPWARVYERFAARLVALRDFRTLCRTGWGLHEQDARRGLQSPYERSITGYGYERGKDVRLAADVVQADRVGLRNFLRTVNARREKQRLPPLALPDLLGAPGQTHA